jgi:hypothetical protein
MQPFPGALASTAGSRRTLVEYGHGLDAICFRISFSNSRDGDSTSDVMRTGVTEYDEFSRRVEMLCFDLPEYITLVDRGKEYQAIGVVPDNDYGIRGTRKAIVVFPVSAEEIQGTMIDIVFDDHLLGTGINHFQFRTRDIQ